MLYLTIFNDIMLMFYYGCTICCICKDWKEQEKLIKNLQLLTNNKQKVVLILFL